MKQLLFTLWVLAFVLHFPVKAEGENPFKDIVMCEVWDALTDLEDVRGAEPRVIIEDPKATIVMVVGSGCPLAGSQLQSLIKLEKEFRAKDVQVYVVYGQMGEQKKNIMKVVNKLDPPFTVLHDADQRITNALEANNLGHTVIMAKDGSMKFQGMIDNAFFAKKKEDIVPYAKNALVSVLAEKKVEAPVVRVDGCAIIRPDK